MLFCFKFYRKILLLKVYNELASPFKSLISEIEGLVNFCVTVLIFKQALHPVFSEKYMRIVIIAVDFNVCRKPEETILIFRAAQR